MSSNKDLTSIISYLKEEKIDLDFEEFEFQVSSHPDFPSLLAYSDALTFFKVPNIAIRLEQEQIDLLPESFLALMIHGKEGELITFVKKQEDQFLCNFGKEQKVLSREEFFRDWNDLIMLVEKSEEITAPSSKSRNSNIGVGLILISMLSFALNAFLNGVGYLNLAFLGLLLGGIYLSMEALKQSLGIDSPATSRFCNATPATSCDSVINSDKLGIFKIISLTDICVLFFTTLLLNFIGFYFLDILTNYYQILALGIWLIVPIGFYSIYFQWKIEKSWCPICLSILGVVIVQTVLIYLSLENLFISFDELYLSLIGFVFSTLFIIGFWYLIKPILFQNKSLKESQLKSLRFQRNYKLFKMALDQGKDIAQVAHGSPLILGNPDAELIISFVINPYCKFCKESHSVIEEILENHEDQVQITIRFNFPATHVSQFIDTEEEAKEQVFLHRTLVDIYRREGPAYFVKALGEWFKHKDLKAWKAKYYKEPTNTNILDAILDAQDEWNRINDLSFTPAVAVGNKIFPSEYYMEKDIQYFIRDLVEDFNS